MSKRSVAYFAEILPEKRIKRIPRLLVHLDFYEGRASCDTLHTHGVSLLIRNAFILGKAVSKKKSRRTLTRNIEANILALAAEIKHSYGMEP